MQTRRNFLRAVSTTPAMLLASSNPADAMSVDLPRDDDQSQVVNLIEGWEFRLDPGGATDPSDALNSSNKWEAIRVPHTWQAMGGSPDFVGVAWYRFRFECPSRWASQHVRIEFEAVNHTAQVSLNGKQVGEHIGKGYTAFTIDLSPHLTFGRDNTLLVRVDNRPNDRMLPRNQSYDWADDGGIIRPVNLLVTTPVFVECVEIDSVPDPSLRSAEIRIRAVARNATPQAHKAHILASVRNDKDPGEILSFDPITSDLEPHSARLVELGKVTLQNPELWHFDSPHLYQASIKLSTPLGVHRIDEQFGIRNFESRGSAFYLNGEKVSLIGVERMAGSHPELGFAETTEWIDSNHRDMKDLNCVFTRVHWPQDRRVLDFCDRNGILMQEEIPAWGPETFSKTSDDTQHALEQNGLEQLREMIRRDRNHPCIVAWGLCNEVDGKNPKTRQFARVIGAEARRLDPSRLQTYASNSLDSNPAADMAGELDFISVNEYYGSWVPGGPGDVAALLDRIRKAFPNKPIVISEYGWCECQPKIRPGDENRVAIVNSHTEVFRRFPEVAGAIYFDYNDYRTLVGDKGKGALRQRVHGVVDLYGARKPSFDSLRLQASPVESAVLRKSEKSQLILDIRTRPQLPAYTLRGYSLRWLAYGYDGLPMEGGKTALPALSPASSYTFEFDLSIENPIRIVADILRPTGFSVITVEFQNSSQPKLR